MDTPDSYPKVQTTLRSQVVLVTIEIALKWLEKNTNNRSVSEEHVKRLSGYLLNNEWHLHGQPIQFGVDGSLIDGQHRLWAIIEAKKSALCNVTWGVSLEAMAAIDSGRRRTAGDVHHILTGETTSKRQVEVANQIYSLVHSLGGRLPQYIEVQPTLEKFKADIDWAIEVLPGRVRLSSAAVKGALAFARKTNPPMLTSLVDKLVTGLNLTATDPAYTLREYLLNSNTPVGLNARRQHLVKVLRGTFAFIYGQPVEGKLYATEDVVSYFGLAHGLRLKGSSANLEQFVRVASGGKASLKPKE